MRTVFRLANLLLILLPFVFPTSFAPAPATVPDATNVEVIFVDSGMGHTCAVTSAGGVLCWGWNYTGQLGDGTTVAHHTPAPVAGLGGRIKVEAVEAGTYATCAITSWKTVVCWGRLIGSEFGNTPVFVNGLSGITALTLGRDHACALTIEGGVLCWGSNDYHQLGDDSPTYRKNPEFVPGLESGIAAIEAGEKHTCALTIAGGVMCWGANSYGETGQAETSFVTPYPAFVQGLESGVIDLGVGLLHTCAVTQSGGVKCWGYNGHSQLGYGEPKGLWSPVLDVYGLQSDVVDVSSAYTYSCARTVNGAVKCWGMIVLTTTGDDWGFESPNPVEILGLETGIQQISAGEYTLLTINGAGQVQCWGKGGGNSSQDYDCDNFQFDYDPKPVADLTNGIVDVAAGYVHSCALSSAGNVSCWGNNKNGQLGDGTNDPHLTPATVVGLEGVSDIAAGYLHTCALDDELNVNCWGDNLYGAIGDGTLTDRLVPTMVQGLGNAIAIASGQKHTCAVTSSGGVQCWGNNGAGQLGNGTKISSATPVEVVGLTENVVAVAGGISHTCALMQAGTVKCWGANQYGQLGNGVYWQSSSTPVDVIGLTNAVSITSSVDHTCTLLSDGKAKCWGRGTSGELGNDIQGGSSMPTDVSIITSTILSIRAGDQYTCAQTMDGLQCWGKNEFGKLGNGANNTSLSPVSVIGFGNGADDFALGIHHTCAVTIEGGVKCWGRRFDGEIGNGDARTYHSPVEITGFDFQPIDWPIILLPFIFRP